jgi:hypothetical protein
MMAKLTQLPECAAVQATLTERLENALEVQTGLMTGVESLTRSILLITSRLEMVEKRNRAEDEEKAKLAEEQREEQRVGRIERRKFGWQATLVILTAVTTLAVAISQAALLARMGP